MDQSTAQPKVASQQEMAQVLGIMRQAAVDQVYMPTFIKEAAALGVPMNTNEDLIAALTIADQVRGSNVKQASQGSILKEAADAMTAATRNPNEPQFDAADLETIKQAATNPVFRTAAIAALEISAAG